MGPDAAGAILWQVAPGVRVSLTVQLAVYLGVGAQVFDTGKNIMNMIIIIANLSETVRQ